LGVVANVAIEDQGGIEVSCKLSDASFKALTDIAERQLGTLRVAGLGDAVSNRAV